VKISANLLDPLGVAWQLWVGNGDPVFRVAEIATDMDADPILVGTRGGGCCARCCAARSPPVCSTRGATAADGPLTQGIGKICGTPCILWRY